MEVGVADSVAEPVGVAVGGVPVTVGVAVGGVPVTVGVAVSVGVEEVGVAVSVGVVEVGIAVSVGVAVDVGATPTIVKVAPVEESWVRTLFPVETRAVQLMVA